MIMPHGWPWLTTVPILGWKLSEYISERKGGKKK